MKKNDIEWVGGWADDLIWCPSQLTREFKLDGSVYELYCRWRWDDPWTFSFYKTAEFIKDFSDWTEIGRGFTNKDPIEEIHNHAEKLLINYLKDTKRI